MKISQKLRDSMKRNSFFKWTVMLVRALRRKHSIAETIRRFFEFRNDWVEFKKLNRNNSFSLTTGDLFPRLFDKTSTTEVDPVYFYQDTWCAKKIFNKKPLKHVDVGSKLDLVGTISQFVPTTMVDIRPPTVTLPELSFVKGSILELPFPDNSIDSLSSICVIEHIGLGRYGDTLDPYGSEKSAKELARVLAKGGSLYVSVPIDNDNKVYFNAHRAFTREYFLQLFPTLTKIEEKYIYGNNVVDNYDKSLGFGTGLYEFIKK